MEKGRDKYFIKDHPTVIAIRDAWLDRSDRKIQFNLRKKGMQTGY